MKSVDILIVEDSDIDYEVTKRLLRSINAELTVARCSDGDQVLAAVRQQLPRGPRLILLDLNMPMMDGHEVLAVLKGDANLKMIPVVILSTSSNDRDITRCYAAGANSYMIKPVDLPRFTYILTQLCNYWFSTVSYAENAL